MARFYTRNTALALSTRPETTFNTASTNAADYTGVLIDPVPLIIPQVEKTPIPGNSEFPEGFCNNYFQPVTLAFNPQFSFTGIMGRLGLQAHGSSVTATQQGGTAAYRHRATLQTAAELKGRSFAMVNDDFSFLYHGLTVNRFALSQTGGELPVCEVEMIGTGKYTEPCPFVVPAATAVCPPTPTTSITITDSYGTRNLYADDVFSWRCELVNGADPQILRQGDDATQGPTGGKGKFVGEIPWTFPRQINCTIRVSAEEIEGASKGYWEQYLTGAQITSITIRLEGETIASTHEYAIDWTIAEGVWTATPLVDNNTILAYDLTLSPTNNATPLTFDVFNITTSNYD